MLIIDEKYKLIRIILQCTFFPIGTYLSDLSLGTKAGGVGQAYQQQSQQGQQVYMYETAIQANYLAPNASVLQRGPAGPVQNNVVPTLQPSSSFYSGSTGTKAFPSTWRY